MGVVAAVLQDHREEVAVVAEVPRHQVAGVGEVVHQDRGEVEYPNLGEAVELLGLHKSRNTKSSKELGSDLHTDKNGVISSLYMYCLSLHKVTIKITSVDQDDNQSVPQGIAFIKRFLVFHSIRVVTTVLQ